MKIRNYERKELVMFFMIILIVLELITVLSLYIIKVNKYYKLNGIVLKDNLVLVVVNKEERDMIYSNKILFLNSHKLKYLIKEDRGVMLKRSNKDYYQLVLGFNFKGKKVNDVLDIVFIKKRIHLIEIFKIIWEGD